MTETVGQFNDDPSVYKTLLESTKAIPWKIDWATLQFTYIGPQIETLLGWKPETWVSVEDWASRMHPDDRQWVVDFCVAQSKAGTDHEADYRALTENGDYVWIRDVVHVVRNDNGDVDSLIGFMFDISERKATEEKLLIVQKELEEYSYKDGLTGVANRRMLDSVLETEWHHAQRHQQPLSVILLDIDYFKEFNDNFGHLQGDECLITVAQSLAGTATRTKDFFGRFGGEEFMLVLPETDAVAASKIAERCRQHIFKCQIPHPQSKIGNVLTISLGVNTIIPKHTDKLQAFINSVDQMLYQAKQAGRNQIQSDFSL
ncbi:MAG: sensor domain-containing diguanylate cyclase [Methylophaga sp.]